MKVAFSPLPWLFGADGQYDPASAPPHRDLLARIRHAGFEAIPADVPPDMALQEFALLLREAGLQAAPGFFSAPLASGAHMPATIDAAKRVAEQHTSLGLTEIFLSDGFANELRIARPAKGVGFDEARLAGITDNAAQVAAAFASEGVRACLHSHVGTWIETAAEVSYILDTVDAQLLAFGPDTGHLAWAGADPVELVNRYRDRVGALHVKDMRTDVARRAQESGLDYMAATAAHLWTEPGRGDVDIDGVLRELGDFDGWAVIEIDIADQPTADESAQLCAKWAQTHLRGRHETHR